MTARIGTAFACLVLLCACGQKGDLFVPDEIARGEVVEVTPVTPVEPGSQSSNEDETEGDEPDADERKPPQ